jgi:2-polyprenyl-3-methyl-5-hydroxy-6-metoxy-1,4-benzoquinol methylase
MTMPSKDKSVFLDIGSGTGVLTNELKKQGYMIYGIDKSKSMVEHCSEKYGDNLPVKHGDIMTPMMYDRNTFSHVLCTNMTIYHFQDKKLFFRNCYYIMKPNGYMILHLVDRERFDPIIQAGKVNGIESTQPYADTRITNTVIHFSDFKYKAMYDFSKIDETKLTETMTDNYSNNVRQNELTLYMEDYNQILKTAMANGFTVKGQVNMKECIGDKNQYLFVLERTL